jgi:trehalose-6-phosphate synthase
MSIGNKTMRITQYLELTMILKNRDTPQRPRSRKLSSQLTDDDDDHNIGDSTQDKETLENLTFTHAQVFNKGLVNAVSPIQKEQAIPHDPNAPDNKVEQSDIVHIGSLNTQDPDQYSEKQKQFIDRKCWEYFGYANVWVDQKEANGHYNMYCKQVRS